MSDLRPSLVEGFLGRNLEVGRYGIRVEGIIKSSRLALARGKRWEGGVK